MTPERFWDYTLAEVFLLIEAHIDTDKRAWLRTAHTLALTYNVHRGRAPAKNVDDFYPYDEHRPDPQAAPPDLTNGVPAIFERMATKL